VAPAVFGVSDARSALLVPMLHRGSGLGVLAAFDRGVETAPFTPEDEQLLRTFAASAAQAVALNRSVEADRLRSTIAAADAERSRWARELHDQTLQSLGGLRVALSTVLGRGDEATKDAAIRQAIEDIELEIANLRGIITDLRPSMLDDLGLVPAIEALLERRRDAGLEVVGEVALGDLASGERGLDPQLETTIYRLVQESLTNVIKHAQASKVRVSVASIGDEVRIEVQDDGLGFDPSVRSDGFGLAGMRERVYLAGGTVELRSGENGTLVQARLPLRADNTASEVGAAAS
jgi:signal transduction histidine kinase